MYIYNDELSMAMKANLVLFNQVLTHAARAKGPGQSKTSSVVRPSTFEAD